MATRRPPPHGGAGLWYIRVGILWEHNNVCCSSHWSDQGNLYTFKGPLVGVASISDAGGQNSYLAADGFVSWLVHDPEEDDQLLIGGIPLTLDPGTVIQLQDSNTKIQYRESDQGGNEWLITSIDRQDGVFVYDNGNRSWSITSLE